MNDHFQTLVELLMGVVATYGMNVLGAILTLIVVDSLGDSSVNILFRAWTARGDWWMTQLDLVQRCKEALEAGGISIPFPQRDVHLIGQAAVPKA